MQEVNDMAGSYDNLLQRKRNEKNKYYTSRCSKQRKYDYNAGKLSRLYKAKSSVANEKGCVYQRYKSIKTYMESSDYSKNWTGNRATQTYENLKKIAAEYMQYLVSIDISIKQLSQEITRLEKENRSLRWEIFQLNVAVNKISYEIEVLTRMKGE